MSLFRRIIAIARSYVASSQETPHRPAKVEDVQEPEVGNERHTTKPSIADASHTIPDAIASDYRFLGVTTGAELPAVEAAWRELVRRADPKRFRPGSEEERKAAELLGRINAAYGRIREHLNPTEGRFGKLEI